MRNNLLLCGIFLILAGCAGKQTVTDYDEVVSVWFFHAVAGNSANGESHQSKPSADTPFLYNKTFEMENYILKDDNGANLYTALLEKASLCGHTAEFHAKGYDGMNLAAFAVLTGTNTVAVKYGEGGLYGGELSFVKATVYIDIPAEPEEFRDIEAVNVGVELPMRDCDGEWSPFFIDKMKNMDIEFLEQIVGSEIKRQFGTKFPEDCKGKIYFITAPMQSIKDGFFKATVRVKVKFD
ncbi:MAG: hypothetical protein A2014_11150 [Spirochaetes bacterium GWF1_49_6]|nr:MAG: hypothetical protein A2014_11150 [Spirochaetes bacterium GWF1_49_6]